LQINRWFVGYAGKRLTEAGISHLLDLGAGLPTEGALHEAVPDTARILYNDFDPATVAYAQQILGEVGPRTNVNYIQGRIEEIDAILMAAEAFFGGMRRVGICMIAVAHFIDDDSLRRVFQRLHAWSDPGSILVLSSSGADLDDPTMRAAIDAYQQRTGATLHLRDADHLAQLLGPWQPMDGGFQSIESYAEEDLGARVVAFDFRDKVGYAGFFSR
jgi:O-methyltransferase involved in polyketide biosynthesis